MNQDSKEDHSDMMPFTTQRATATALLLTESLKTSINSNICENVTSPSEIDCFSTDLLQHMYIP